MIRNRSIGWYGRPGHRRPYYQVHLHDHLKHGPACGTRMHPDAEYQWCSWTATDYIECQRCQRIAAGLLRDAPPNVAVGLNAR